VVVEEVVVVVVEVEVEVVVVGVLHNLLLHLLRHLHQPC